MEIAAMPTPSPIYGWDLPTLSEVADGPAAFAALASDIETTLASTTVQTYLPSWTSLGIGQPANPVTRTGVYRINHGICDFEAQLTFGDSTSGGYGHLVIGLPVTAKTTVPTQVVHCVLYTPVYGSTVWIGAGLIDGGTTYQGIRPHFPLNADRSDMWPWTSVGSIFNGLAVPAASGSEFSVQNGGSITIHGRYFVQ